MRDFFPLQNQRVLMMGVGGIGMSALAKLYRAAGAQITGCDAAPSKTLQDLEKLGIDIQDEADISMSDFDLVVHTHAVSDTHPLLVHAKDKRIWIEKRGEVITKLLSKPNSIGITGSHGKTTVTFLTGTIFNQQESKPTILGGGIDQVMQTNCQVGDGPWLIAELDESDHVFCQARPPIVAITNLDHEHVNAFPTFKDLEMAFISFIDQLPADTVLILNGDDTGLVNLMKKIETKILVKWIGQKKESYLVLKEVLQEMDGLRLTIACQGETHILKSRVFGYHNASNILLSISLAMEAGIPMELIRAGLLAFRGVRRRMENLVPDGVSGHLISDYAHHPTEIKAVLEALKLVAGSSKLVAVFEPHRISRMEIFFDAFIAALQLADEVILVDCHTAGEEGNPMELTGKMLKALQPVPGRYVPTLEVFAFIQKNYLLDEYVVLLTAGKLDAVIRESL